MSNPIVFISRFHVKPGMQNDFKKHYQESSTLSMTNKPSTLAQLAYFSDGSENVTIVRIFPDAQAMDRQLQGADERSKISYQFIEPTQVEIYGKPNQFSLEMMKKAAGSGIKVDIHPEYIGGFIRLADSADLEV